MSAIDPKKEIINITNESTIHAFGTDVMIDVEKDIWYAKCMNPNAKKDIIQFPYNLNHVYEEMMQYRRTMAPKYFIFFPCFIKNGRHGAFCLFIKQNKDLHPLYSIHIKPDMKMSFEEAVIHCMVGAVDFIDTFILDDPDLYKNGNIRILFKAASKMYNCLNKMDKWLTKGATWVSNDISNPEGAKSALAILLDLFKYRNFGCIEACKNPGFRYLDNTDIYRTQSFTNDIAFLNEQPTFYIDSLEDAMCTKRYSSNFVKISEDYANTFTSKLYFQSLKGR